MAGYPDRSLRKRYLIVTDGLLTESGYFEKLKPLVNDALEIVAKNKDVDILVAEVVRRMKRSSYDESFIVCDIDERLKHKTSKKKLIDAIGEAGKNGVKVCLSNESFEIWLLAHKVKVSSADGSRGSAHARAVKLGIVCGNNGKEVGDGIMTKDNIQKAIIEAERLKAVYGGDALTSNPNTDVHELVAKLDFK